MPYLITLSEEAEMLADGIYTYAILSLEDSSYGNFEKACEVLEHALRRCERRNRKAELVF